MWTQVSRALLLTEIGDIQTQYPKIIRSLFNTIIISTYGILGYLHVFNHHIRVMDKASLLN